MKLVAALGLALALAASVAAARAEADAVTCPQGSELRGAAPPLGFAGPTAPARGLVLARVDYPEGLSPLW